MLSAAMKSWLTTGLLLAAILAGSLLGGLAPRLADPVANFADPLILLLVGTLFFTLRLDGLAALRRAPRTVLLALGVNFLLIPLIAYPLTLLLPNEALRLGVLIYCLAPCTDWFLGFIRLAGGDTVTGAALIPVQMLLQLLLFPIWLAVFAETQTGPTITSAGSTILTWFVLPATIGLGLRLILKMTCSARLRSHLVAATDRMIPAIIAAVIVAIFAGNVTTILANPTDFAWVLLVVFVFFVLTYLLGEGTARVFRLSSAAHAVLTMTTSARNAPLMLALTTITLPDRPLIHAAIILGMLIEFPHLTAITQLLRRQQVQPTPASEYAMAS